MRYLIVILLAGVSLFAATPRAGRPRLLTAAHKAELVAKRTANTPQWAGLKAYVDANLNATGTYTISYLVTLVPLVYQVTGDPLYAQKAITMINLQLDRMAGGFNVLSVTPGSSTAVLFDAPHGITVGGTRRCYPSFFSGSWSGFRGERTCTATSSTAVTVNVNSSAFGAWSPNGSEMAFRSGSGSFASDFGADKQRTQWWKFAYAYDLLYDQLSTQDRLKWSNLLKGVVEWATESSYYGFSDRDALGNLGSGKMMFLSYALSTLYEESWADSASLWAGLMDRVENLATIINTSTAKGGALAEGSEYGPQSKIYILRTFDAIASATGDESIWNTIPDWPEELARMEIHASSPSAGGNVSNKVQPAPDGDVESDKVEVYSPYTRSSMLRVMQTLLDQGKTSLAAQLRGWMNAYTPIPNNLYTLQEDWFEQIHCDEETLTPLNYVQPSLNWHASGNGRIYSRSSWTPSATWTGFDSGRQNVDHAHAQAGGFFIWRKGKYLTRKIASYGGIGFFPVGNNVLLLNGRGTVERGGAANTYWKAGFSRYHVEEDNSYLYARAAVGSLYPYRASTLTSDPSTYRDLVWFKNRDLWIGFDYCKFTPGTNKHCSYIMQTLPDFTTDIAGNRFTLTEPDTGQKLHVDTVHPSTAVITSRSHKYDYLTAADHAGTVTVMLPHDAYASGPMTISGVTGPWAVLNGTWPKTSVGSDGHVYKLSGVDTSRIPTTTPFVGQSAIIGTNTLVSTGRAAYSNGGFVEVTAGVLANAQNHLFVMRATDAGAAAPVAAPKLSAANLIATQIDDLVVGFVPADSVTLPVSYTYTPQTMTQHRLFGFEPGGTYHCDTSVSGSVAVTEGTGCTADASGILSFSRAMEGVSTKVIAIGPTAFDTYCSAGSGEQPGQSLPFTISNGGALWTAQSSHPARLRVSPASGSGASESVIATPDCTGLTVGDHTATLQVASTDPGVVNSPQSVEWTIHVAAVSANVSVPSTPVQFSYQAYSGMIPGSQSANVTIVGQGASCTASETTSWFSISPGGAFAASQSIAIALADAAVLNGLPAGTHTGTVTVTCTGAVPAMATIEVRLNLTKLQFAIEYTGTLDMQMSLGGPAPSTFVEINTSTGITSYTASVTGPFEIVSGASGPLTTTPVPVIVRATAGAVFGSNDGTLTIVVEGASNNPVSIPVTLQYDPVTSVSVSGGVAMQGSVTVQ